jgi:hypothetical protein
MNLQLLHALTVSSPPPGWSVQMSRLMFVDMPGAERLAMDPEVLLLREGVLLNKSLLDFSRGRPQCLGPSDVSGTHLEGVGVRCVPACT